MKCYKLVNTNNLGPKLILFVSNFSHRNSKTVTTLDYTDFTIL